MTIATANAPRLLQAIEAAKILGVSLRTLDTYTKKHGLKKVKVCGKNQYDIDDVRAFIESHKSCS